MTNGYSGRAEHEIAHGKLLATAKTETIWGWGTQAGYRRAKRRGDLVAKAAKLGPGVLALEVGCGTGVFTELFAQTGATIVAVDISPELLEKAKARGLPVDRVRFLCQRFEECNLQGPFDAVVGSSVLHHLEIKPALATIYSLLKPGGIMSFAEPNMLNPQIMIERSIPLLRLLMKNTPDETAFFRWQLAKALRRARFVDVRVKPFDFLHPKTPPFWITAVSKVGMLLERLPIVQEIAGSLVITATRGGTQQADGNE